MIACPSAASEKKDTDVNTLRIGVLVTVLCFCAGCPLAPTGNDTSGQQRVRITQDQIDSGEMTLDELLFAGRNLCVRNWKVTDGFGNGRGHEPPNINRLPGPDSTSCISCHGVGNNVVLGWGGNQGNVLVALDDPVEPTISGSNERNTPTEHGLSLLELLGKEMSLELRGSRDDAIVQAETSGSDVTIDLTSKGVSFGTLTAHADGSVDTSGVVGIDADLRVRPFHAKGHEATIRIFTRNALNRHHGIQSTELLYFMDSTKDPATWDQDEDGVVNEVTEGELTAMTAFQECMPIPEEVDQTNTNIAAGRELMQTIGCTECHRPTLPLEDPVWRYTSSGGATLAIDLTDHDALGAGRPALEADGSVLVHLWGDLKRHDLGEESHEPLDQPVDLSKPNYEDGGFAAHLDETLAPIPKELMLTTELWGVRDTAPWWHDGSSPTIEDAILRHGGEAQASRDAYAALTADEQSQVLAFLNSLVVADVGEVLVTSDPGANAKEKVGAAVSSE